MTSTRTRQPLIKIKDEVDYYQHQLDGIRQMARMGSILLADEMGLGKSLEALTVAAIDFEIGAAARVLIVSPASLKWNWETELSTFTNFTWVMLDGTPKVREEQLREYESLERDVLIVNYEQVKSHLATLNRLKFDIVICDEAHYIKNRRAARTKAIHQLVAKRFLLLTGSPLLNHVDDLWSLLHRLKPLEFKNYFQFVNRYVVFGGYKDKEVVSAKNVAELTSRVQPLMVRRLKKDVGIDLPPKQHIPILVDLHAEQRKLYNQARDELMIDLPDGADPMEVDNALTRFLRLKQVCGTTACIPGYPDVSIKLDVAIERIEDLIEGSKLERKPGEHVVVFTQFREVQACLNRRLAERDIPYFELHGDVPKPDRVPITKAWSETAEPAVMSAMLQVAGVGLNMTRARSCIFIDKLFVPKLNEQAEDRLHRIGATGEFIQIFSIIARGTIEQRVEQILRRKTKIFGQVIEGDTNINRLLMAALKEELEEAA